MHVLQVLRTTRASYGGPPGCAINLADALECQGHQVDFITADDQGLGSIERDREPFKSVTVRPALGERGFLYGADLRRARECVRHADVVHIHEVWELMYWQIARLCQEEGKPFCITAHGSLSSWAMRNHSRRKRLALLGPAGRMLREAAFVHFTADAERASCQAASSIGKTVVIPNIIDVRPYLGIPSAMPARKALNVGDEAPVLLCMNRICPGKGLEHVIQAIPSIRRAIPRVVVGIAGSGERHFVESLRRRCRDLGVSEAVRFLGFVSGELKASLLAEADLLLLPSEHENFGNVLFEAAALGTPTIVSDGVATADILTSCGAAVKAKREAAAIAAEAIKHLSVPRSDHRARRERIRRWALEFLQPERLIREYIQAYQGAMAG